MRIQQELDPVRRRISTGPTTSQNTTVLYSPAQGTGAVSRQKLSPAMVLSLQHTRGNAAVCRMLAARRNAVVQRDEDDEETEASSESDTESSSNNDYSAAETETSEAEASESEESQATDSDTDNTDTDDYDSDNDSDTETDSEDSSDNDNEDSSDSSDTDSNENTEEESEAGDPVLQPVSKSVPPKTMNAAFAEAKGTATDNPTGNLTINSASYKDLGDGTTRVTGQATATFAANVKMNLPTVPDSITDPCEKEQYQKAINTTLDAHEKKHKKLYEQFDGSVRSSFSEVGNTVGAGQDMPDVTAALNSKLVDPPMDRNDPNSRLSKAEAASAAIDPFTLQVDTSKCNTVKKV